MKITHPTLIVDEQQVRKNIQHIAEKADRSGVTFRPHFKTHQSAAIGEWFREAGVQKITVSSVRMAQYFSEHRWDDILLAFPVNLRAMDELQELARKVQLGLLVDQPETAQKLAQQFTAPVNVWLEIDVGDKRTGIKWNAPQHALPILKTLREANHLHLKGLLTHAGHTYDARSEADIQQYYDRMVERLHQFKNEISSPLHTSLRISIGDTPTASVIDNFEQVDELRPGNLVFYDLMQVQAGACQVSDIAVVLACPVVGKYHSRQELVVHGGAVHLSKDHLRSDHDTPLYGKIVRLTANGWSPPVPHTYVCALSQEHGVIKCSSSFFEEIAVGDAIGILPVHSCLTAHLMGRYQTLIGQTMTTLPI